MEKESEIKMKLIPVKIYINNDEYFVCLSTIESFDIYI